MGAVDAELTGGGAGGTLAAESLANVLAVHLIRHPWHPAGRRAGRYVPRGKLRGVVAHIEGHLVGRPTLGEMAGLGRFA